MRKSELTEELLPKIEEFVSDKNYVNTLQIRKRFGCTGKRAAHILTRLGFSHFSKSARYQVYYREKRPRYSAIKDLKQEELEKAISETQAMVRFWKGRSKVNHSNYSIKLERLKEMIQ